MQRAILAVMRAAEACAFKELSLSKSLWAEAPEGYGSMAGDLGRHAGLAAKDPDYFFPDAGPLFCRRGRKGQATYFTTGPL